jgi:4-hydroxy-2-oxoheptanedioate aldolase
LRDTWAGGGCAIGGWLSLGSPFAAEIVASQRLDYLVVDWQHGLVSHQSMIDVLGALAHLRPVPLVRVPSRDPVWIGHALDAGAEGVIVPMVDSGAQAAEVVAACRFPPFGSRSFGPIRSRRQLGHRPERMNDGVLCLAMVETADGLAAVDEICATPGLTGVYVGPADLAIALGQEPIGSSEAPELRAVFDAVRTACERHAVIAGVHGGAGAEAARFVEDGFAMVTAVSDVAALRSGAAHDVALARAALQDGGGLPGTGSGTA